MCVENNRDCEDHALWGVHLAKCGVDVCRVCLRPLPTGYEEVHILHEEEYIRHRIKRCPLCGGETWL